MFPSTDETQATTEAATIKSLKKTRKRIAAQSLLVEELEPRILLSAGIEGVLFGGLLNESFDNQFSIQALLNADQTETGRQELVFVDASTPDYETLIQQLLNSADGSRFVDVIVIHSDSDGISQISQALIQYNNLDAIHIISHGSDGAVQLGNSALTDGSLSSHAGLIEGWQDALEQDADILFYGCDLAAGDDGRSLLDRLAALTGADIAASADLTGHADRGGNWTLEYHSGEIEAYVVADSVTQKAWRGLLSNVSGSILEDVDGNGNLADAIALLNVSVQLYLDDGDGIINAGDTWVSSTLTNAAGMYNFAGLADATYWVVVDSTTVAPNAGFNASFSQANVWAEQTYGSSGAVSFNGSYNYLASAGSFFGGMQGERSDDVTSLLTAEHVTRVIIAGADVGGVDSAFSFNAITRTGDGDDDLVNARSIQGSLRQFIQNANAIVGIQTSDFSISTTDSNYNTTGNGEYTIHVTGAGFDYITDTIILDAHSQEGWLSQPVIELDGAAATGSSAAFLLRSSDSLIRGFIIHSFNDEGLEIDGSTGFGDNNTLQNNWVGIDATGAAAANLDNGILVTAGASSNTIGGTGANDGNVIGSNASDGILIRNAGSDNNTVQGNYVGVGTDGISIRGNFHGIRIFDGASSNVIGGTTPGARNIISGNDGNGIVLWDAATMLNVVSGNYIGTDATGTIAVGNLYDGVYIGGGTSNNTIGGIAPNAGNLISGNVDDGVEIGFAGTSFNAILGNYIGTDASGSAPLGNGRYGVVIYDGASDNQIGIAGAGNVISANGDDGIVIDANLNPTTSNNVIAGNLIGLDASGTTPLGNAGHGIWLESNADNNTIGGAGPGDGNFIADNAQTGIGLISSDNITILGNFIGTATDGITAIPNANTGIWLSNSDFTNIGDPGAGNVIAGNGIGIQIGSSDFTSVQGNFIGTDLSGTIALSNGGSGMVLWGDTSGTMIGGTIAGQGNIIANSSGHGIFMSASVGSGNSILGNSIHSNQNIGIEQVQTGPIFGVTPNDPLDADSGPNGLQNYPIVISSNTNEAGIVYVGGAINAAASTTYRIEFFANSVVDASGHGQGETYLGFINVTTDINGHADFSAVLGATVTAGAFISTTATAPDGSTSEFSANADTHDMGTLVVDISTDNVDGNTSSIAALLANRGADNRISLREAIMATNNTLNAGSPDQIIFNLQLDDPNRFYYQDDGIAGSLSTIVSTTLDDADIADFDPDYNGINFSWFRIQPVGAMNTIDEALIIDGYSQQGATPNTMGIGSDAVMKIVLDGDLSGNTDALVIYGSGSEIRGLAFTGDFRSGISLYSDNNIVSGNHIGTDATGMVAGNLNYSVYIRSGATNNLVGGIAAADRNLLSGTTNVTVWILDATTQNNTIQGNYIGLNALGTAAMTNPSAGVFISEGAHDNVIQDNVISGNTAGIFMDGTTTAPDSNSIIGNLIGTDATGAFAVANTTGIWLRRGVTNTTIGGTNAAERNVISGNTGDGILIEDAVTSGNVIIGNFIGMDISGTADLGNGQSGIDIAAGASGNFIGGSVAGARNIISGNSSSGIQLRDGASNNTIAGNFVGLDVSGTLAFSNGFGIYLQSGANNNIIGGTTAGSGNVISGNFDGIHLNGATTSNNLIQGNLIGTDFSGTVAVGNTDDGIEIVGAANNTVGGSAPGARNTISGNINDGITITSSTATGNLIAGNYIGLDINGTATLGNGSDGIELTSTSSATTIDGNVISANTSSGIRISGDSNIVTGNLIGTDAGGSAALGNLFNGVTINSGSGNLIGGTTAADRNIISGNNSSGVSIYGAGATSNTVSGNYIGTDISGTTDVGNGLIGIDIRIGATNNLIGGTAAGAGNLISGNRFHGVTISDSGTTGNRLEGNIIGLDVSGTAALDNGQGIWIHSGATSNYIGGTAAGAGNVISGNTGAGVMISGIGTNNNYLHGNYIGTNAAGDAAVANTWHGVRIYQGASSNQIGGTDPAARNVISGNTGVGVQIENSGTAANSVRGNYIGTNASGDAAIGNAGGINIRDSATLTSIGSSIAGGGNLISGNNSYGVQIDNASNNFVQGNLIGTDASGTGALGNTGTGVTMKSGAAGNSIGGVPAGWGNTIAYNGNDGIRVEGDAGINNSILSNSIHSNARLGIDLGSNGINPNDTGDVDGIQNFPVLVLAYTDGVGTITIEGTINGAASTTYRIEFFANASGDISGNGEGEIYLGFIDVTTDASGNASFSVALSAVVPVGHLISATATGPGTGTSEFAGNIVASTLPPVLDLDADDSSGQTGADFQAGFIEDGGPVLIADTDAVLVDPDSPFLQWLTVTISNLLDGIAELLTADTTGTSIVANYDPLTGILTLSGADTVAHYLQVLRTVGYDNSSNNPDTTARLIEIVANDGGISSNVANATVSVTATNDAPVLTPSSPSLPDITEDAVGNNGILISTLLGGSLTDVDTGALSGIAVSGLNNSNGAWEYSTDGGLTWLAVGTVSDSSALLLRSSDRIRFVPDAQNADNASFDFRGWDQSNGAFGTKVDVSTNGDDSPYSTASDTASINVTAVNDAPVLTPSAPSLPDINEDAVGNNGILISTLLGGSLSDVDTGAFSGIAVTGLNSSNGSWEYSTDGGLTWIAVGTVSDSSALLLRSSDRIRFVPDAQNADNASFDFRGWDQSNGGFGTKVDVSTNGDDSPYSTASDTASINVTDVNDAPVLAPAAPGLPDINEDAVGNNGILISTLLGGSLSDVDNGALSGIAVTSLNSGNGTWEYSTDGGLTWIAVGTVSDSSALLLRSSDRIRFIPDTQNADNASFDFRGWDQSNGTFGTKVDVTTNGNDSPYSTASDTASINVTAVNDAPVLAPAAPGLPDISEDDVGNSGILISTLLGGSLSDVDTGALSGIAVTGLNSSNGTWEYSTDGGLTWIAVGTVSDSSALLLRSSDRIRFVPDAQNADNASFDFRGWDQSNGAFGTKVDVSTNGNDSPYSTASDTASINVTAVNNAPVLAPSAPSLPDINEDAVGNNGILISTLLGGSLSDVDNGALSGIAVTGLNNSNGSWEYSTDGGLTWLAVGTVSDSSALLLRSSDRIRFVPDSQNADNASFDFRGWDQSSGAFGTKVDVSTNGDDSPYSTAGDTASINVTAINDAPVLTPSTPSLSDITEDAVGNSGILVHTLLGGSLSDVDTGALSGIAVTGLNNSNGSWEYSTDGGLTWIAVGTVSDSSALLLRSTDRIRFVPDAQNADSATFDFRGWDQSNGAFGTKVDVSTNGNDSPYSAASDTASINVTAINDSPYVISPGATAIDEDGPTLTYDLQALFGDFDDTVESLAFSIVSNDNPLVVIASIDPATGQLMLTSGADMNGVANLTIRATDSGGEFAETSVTVTVNPIDDAVINVLPIGQVVNSGQFLLLSSALGNSLTITDIDSNNVTISLSIVGGFLTLGSTTGLSFSVGDGSFDQQMTFTGSISDVNAALDGLLFQPTAAFSGIAPLQISSWSEDLPLAERAPVSSETLSIVVLDTVPIVPVDLPDPQSGPDPIQPLEDEVTEKPATAQEPGKKPAAAPAEADFEPSPAIYADFLIPAIELPAAVEPALADNGFDGTRERLSAVAKMLLQLGVDGKLPAFIISDAVMDALDSMRDQMSGLDDSGTQEHEFLVTLATGLTLTLSAGFVSYIMRAGALLTSLLSTTPLWQSFDPLPVLDSRDDEDDEEDDADAVRSLFRADK